MSKSNPQPSLEGVSVLTLPSKGPTKDWLAIASEAFSSSTDWFKESHYAQWERNIYNYRGIHPPGSKYLQDKYKRRSRLFRPVTRTTMRKIEEAVVTAQFNNPSLVSLTPQDPNSVVQAAASSFTQALIEERLRHSVPWYMLVSGAVQDAEQYGICVSYQHWDYAEENGEVLRDKPQVELVPPENIRIDGGADWMDPIGTSPYVIQLLPMYIGDVLQKMEEIDTKSGQPKWKKVSRGDLLASSGEDYDAVRMVRESPKSDPKGNDNRVPGYETVWVHRNIFRDKGEDWLFYTAGTSHLLSKPVRLLSAFPWLRRGERPYAVGTMALESHRAVPASLVELGQGLQASANDVVNRRQDNVMLAMDKRFILRRGSNIDRKALYSSTPGGAIETDDPTTDVKVIETGDVTSSSYREQDTLNLDYDELFGAFSNSSVAKSSRSAETFGGLSLLASAAKGQVDLFVRTFQQTWVTNVLGQLMRLEQYYENNLHIMAAAADKAGVQLKVQGDGKEQDITAELLRQQLTIHLNVGISATDPMHRVNSLMVAANALSKIPGVAQRLDEEEISKEIFGAVGFADGKRFLRPRKEGSDPEKDALKQRIAELESGVAVEKIKVAGKQQIEQIRQQAKMQLSETARKLKELDSLIRAEKNDITRGELELKRDTLVHTMLKGGGGGNNAEG